MESALLGVPHAESVSVAGNCAALRSKAQGIFERSQRACARSREVAAHMAAVQTGVGCWWRLGAPGERELPRLLPISGGATTESVVRDFIAATCLAPGDGELGDDEPILANGILDSLGILRLAVFIEETFGVAVPEEAFLPEHFSTVRRVATFVESLEARAVAQTATARA